jgi:acetyl-CoA C-acetyltransferase
MIDAAVRAGDLDVAVAGGMESMSQAPYLLPQARFGARMGDMKALDAMVHDGLTNPFSGKQMFEDATEVGDELELTRADMDRWALRSHQRTIAATDDGRLPEEIAPVTVKGRKGETVVEVDEAPRRDTTLERLAALPGLTGRDGSHTAGNSPGVNDGAGASSSPRTRGRRRGAGVAGRDRRPGRRRRRVRLPGPHPGERRAGRARQGRPAAGRHRPVGDQRGVRVRDAALHRMLGIDEDRVNVNGGAVAIGHPIGASGARILGTLVHELRRRGGGYGCAAICSGGGQGDAVIVRV